MGTGTFIPSAEMLVLWPKGSNGWLTKLRGEYSFYENSKDYLPGSALRWEAGYWHQINPKMMVLGQLKGNHEQADSWKGLQAPFSGRHALSASSSFTGKVRRDWELIFRVEQLLWVRNITGMWQRRFGLQRILLRHS